MFKIDYNPCSKKYHEWFSGLSQEQQQEITKIEDNYKLTPKLIKLKRNRKPVEVHIGDVFIVSNQESVYFYGKVLQEVNTKHEKYSWSEKCFVAFIFKNVTNEKNLDHYMPSYDNCVRGPELLDFSYFEKGYLEIIGNIPLTKEEKKMDIGFFDGDKNGGVFIDAKGRTLLHFPKYYEHSGFVTPWGIASSLSIAYITDPALFK